MTTQQVEGELTVANAALTALNSRLSKERKSLGQQVRKRNAKQKQLQSSSTTLELVRADAKSAQVTLEKARAAHQRHQAMLEEMVAENEDLKAKCAHLLEQNHDAERMLSTLSANVAATSQLVEIRVRTLTDTYLADSDALDWHDVISHISKEVRRITKSASDLLLKHPVVFMQIADTKINEQSKFQHKCAESAANVRASLGSHAQPARAIESRKWATHGLLQLRTKYGVMFAALNEKFSRMLQDKVRMNADVGVQQQIS